MRSDEASGDLFSGDRRALARAVTAVEAREPARAELLRLALQRAGRAFVIGLTGPPGAGKSTLTDRLIAAYRQLAQRVAVLAVDPTSPITGGAVLGDRIRMQAHSGDAGVFVRSMATRGASGGLARAAADVVTLLDASGFDVVIVETVGVGQAEVQVAHLADVTVVLGVPGAGDEVQAMKAGLMEVGDVFVVNKADRDGAGDAVRAIESALSLAPAEAGSGRTPVLQVSATMNTGIAELVAVLGTFKTGHELEARRQRRLQLVAGETARIGWELDHIAIATNDEAASRHFFEELIGLRGDASEVVERDQVRVTFLGSGQSRIELVMPEAETSSVANFIRKRGQGLHHVALRVYDLDKTLKDLASRGVRLIDPAPRVGAHGRLVAFIHPASTGGVLVELVEAGSGH